MPQRKQNIVKEGYQFPKSFVDLSNSLSKSYFKPQPSIIISDQIIVIDKFFSNSLCDELIDSFQTNLTLETTPVVKSKLYATRFNDRCSINDPVSASKLWNYLKKLLVQDLEYEDQENLKINEEFENAIGLNPQLRIYRYVKGHHFNKHYDESVDCKISDNRSGRTKWTLLIYLTGDDEFKGGGTIFYPPIKKTEGLNIHPKKGMALLHKHGDECLLHEAEIVKEGEKWVFRSDVVFPI